MEISPTDPLPQRTQRRLAWRFAWTALALVYAWPLAWSGYQRLMQVNEQARARLIVQHHLWETQPDFQGTPESWTDVASRLFTDGQLLRRVARKYGPDSEQIEVEYRRDVAIARAEVVMTWLALWAAPLAVLHGIVALARRRPPSKPPATAPQPASVSDPRYRPPPRTT